MSSPPTRPAKPPRVWDDPRIVMPDEAAWERLSPSERDAAEEKILGALSEYREAMSEGVRHFRAKTGAAADLDGHFRRAGRDVFTACELGVLYPGEAAIVPDVLAVMDCDPDLEVDTWNVAVQKRGIDLVYEVRNQGKKHKDLVENVVDYARLRIPEYFSFDVRSKVLRGWHLPTPRSRVYQPILPQGGYLASGVLALELAVIDGRVRFFASGALVPTTGELIARLQEMVDRTQLAANESQQAAAAATDRAARLTASLATSILRVCERRGLSLDDRQRARVIAEDDGDRLAGWLDRALVAEASDDVFADA